MPRKIDNLINVWVGSYSINKQALSLYRIFFASYAILFGLKRFAWVADYPGGLWRPPFPFSLFDTYGSYSPGLYAGPMPSYALLLLEGTLCLLFVLLLLGALTPYVSVTITALIIVLNWQIYSLPKTNHDILFCVTPLMMALSGWGHFFSLDAQKIRTGSAYPSTSSALLALTITTGFAVAGLPKLIHWVDFDLTTSGVRMWVTGIYFPDGGGGPLSSLMAYTTAPLLWEAMDVAAVCFEVGFLITVWQRQYFRLWLSLAVVFHFANYLMLGIPFLTNLPVYAAFLPWDQATQTFTSSMETRFKSLLSNSSGGVRVSFFAALLGLSETLYFIHPKIGFHGTGATKNFQVVLVFGAAFGVLGYLAYTCWRPKFSD